ncbi:MAG TPA: hypothetical protein PLX88_08935 [Syntrophorhabdaceae bacterium]|jgi:hypothetical protein|nr:hypothetical protein [Syntrophorhabdaceae bacterium]MDI9560528.1 hypothetical protein [Pseudomonadota bacterium]OQC51199.1 MAG: hypothetical protein BWX58_00315 [Deltaproteobacteria bacterium ADurb.Bin026]MBP8698365.1 hypothetical protein [Syntrophorhabdaceae bacterium]MBV6505374.1 hypothetical protein [Syntrophorhabdaceae bacterium]
MPLLFKSLSHGEIPFGFFNIETDMILLNNYFFFASDFALYITDLAAKSPDEISVLNWNGYVLKENDIGNLMAAISGVYLSGFIGEVYGYFPFPHEPDKFKQNPEGYKTRNLIEGIIKRYVPLTKIPLSLSSQALEIKIGDYLFEKVGFHELLLYLWVGGYPRWKDEVKPGYIIKMKEAITLSCNPLFKGIVFE